MTTFDDRFADRVREAFDAYEEPVDERALARLQSALGATPALAPDRPAAPSRSAAPPRWRGLAVLATLLVAATGTWLALADRTAPLDGPQAAEVTATPEIGTAPDLPTAPETEPPRVAQVVPPRGPVADLSTTAPRRPRPEAAAPVRPDEASVQPEPAHSPEAAPDEAAVTLASLEPITARPPASLEVRAPAPGRGVSGAPIRLGVWSPAPEAEGLRLVVASGTIGSGADLNEGASVAAGVSREWAVSRSVAVSGGALLAYGRTVPEAETAAAGFLGRLTDMPGTSVEVADRQVVTTVALEVPVDVTLDVVRASRGRLRASVGLTSALYLDQRFEDEGTLYSSERISTDTQDETVALSSETFTSEETVGVLGRLDLGRQLNLGLGVVGAGRDALGVDVYVRLPLGGVTSRDLPLTVAGVRLRVPLP